MFSGHIYQSRKKYTTTYTGAYRHIYGWIPPPTARECTISHSHELNNATGAHSGGQSKAARGPDPAHGPPIEEPWHTACVAAVAGQLGNVVYPN